MNDERNWDGGQDDSGHQPPRYEHYQFHEEHKETLITPGPSEHKKNQNSFQKKVGTTVALAVIFGLVASVVFQALNFTADKYLKTKTGTTQIGTTESVFLQEASSQESESDQTAADTASGNGTVVAVAQASMPSVVAITTVSVQEIPSFFGYGSRQYKSAASGSGIIVGQNGSEILVATNNHVVADADTITVAFDDDAVYEAQVKGTDSDNDLAVVAVKISDMSEDTLKSIKVVSIGNSDELEIGEQVVAIGNALGYGQSVTSGWISAVDREVTDEDGKTTGKLIQTDAAINPGNIGGALLNMQGELIGINSAKAAATEVEGMGYAIPVSVAQPILDELMNRETRYKADEDHAGYIGVTCLNVDSTSAQTYGIPLGAFVDSVEEGGPAQTAGIQKGDVIVKFDGMTVSGSSDLVGKLEYYQAGETVEVVISRAQNGEYQEQTVSVTLGKKSEMKQADPQQGK